MTADESYRWLIMPQYKSHIRFRSHNNDLKRKLNTGGHLLLSLFFLSFSADHVIVRKLFSAECTGDKGRARGDQSIIGAVSLVGIIQ